MTIRSYAGRMRLFHELTTGIWVATSRRGTTTTTAIGDGSGGCLLVDPAMEAADLPALAADLRAGGLTPVAGIATHPHWDHVLWHRDFGDVPRYASPAAIADVAEHRTAMIDYLKASVPGHDLERFGILEPATERINWPGQEVRLITHNGHAPGHTALFLPDSGVFIAGDMLSDIEIPILEMDSADPGGDYRAALRLFAALPGVRWLVPGHGHVTDGAGFRDRLAADTDYLDRLEAGERFSDPRTGEDWLRDTHDTQLTAFARR